MIQLTPIFIHPPLKLFCTLELLVLQRPFLQRDVGPRQLQTPLEGAGLDVGRRHLAERIRQIARAAGVPIVREPPLALF